MYGEGQKRVARPKRGQGPSPNWKHSFVCSVYHGSVVMTMPAMEEVLTRHLQSLLEGQTTWGCVIVIVIAIDSSHQTLVWRDDVGSNTHPQECL